jgi:Zn-dependent oligopeptidase
LCFEKNIIKQLSKHYKSGNKLDDNIINKIIKLKNLDIALYYKKHILIALFDQIIYSSQKFIDTCENYLKNSKSNELENLMSNLYLQLHDEIMKSNDDNIK